MYLCLTQLFGGIDMYYLLHRNQLHVVDFYVINNTYLLHQIVVLDIRYISI